MRNHPHSGKRLHSITGLSASQAKKSTGEQLAKCGATKQEGVAKQEITAKDVAAGLEDGARWLFYTGDYTGQRFSPLAQIPRSTSASCRRNGRFKQVLPTSSKRR